MSDSGAKVSASYARSLFDYLRALGLDPATVLPEVDIAAIESREGQSAAGLEEWLGLIASAMSRTDDPDLALKVGERLQIRHLGLAGYVLMSCHTLGEAEAQIGRFLRLLGQVGGSHVERHGNTAALVFDWASAVPPPALEKIFAAAATTLSRWLTEQPELQLLPHFRFERPADIGHFERIFRCVPAFEQAQTKLVFPAGYLDLPVIAGNPQLRSLVQAQAEAALQSLDDEPPLLRQVKAAVLSALPSGKMTMAQIAKALGLSERSLRRRLEEAGCPFRTLLEQQRQLRAETLLRNPEISLTEIAFLLGYSEQSAFNDAFKRWTGATPGQFRAGKR